MDNITIGDDKMNDVEKLKQEYEEEGVAAECERLIGKVLPEIRIIADEMAIGMINQKTTAVRIIPVEGKDVGDTVEFGGLLGYAPIMKVSEFSCDEFIDRGGRIPSPIHSFKN